MWPDRYRGEPASIQAAKHWRSYLVGLLFQFPKPLVAILLLASIVSGFWGVPINGAIIVTIVVLRVTMSLIQTFARSTTWRKGCARRQFCATVAFADIPRVKVVSGDVIRLSGDWFRPMRASRIEGSRESLVTSSRVSLMASVSA